MVQPLENVLQTSEGVFVPSNYTPSDPPMPNKCSCMAQRIHTVRGYILMTLTSGVGKSQITVMIIAKGYPWYDPLDFDLGKPLNLANINAPAGLELGGDFGWRWCTQGFGYSVCWKLRSKIWKWQRSSRIKLTRTLNFSLNLFFRKLGRFTLENERFALGCLPKIKNSLKISHAKDKCSRVNGYLSNYLDLWSNLRFPSCL